MYLYLIALDMVSLFDKHQKKDDELSVFEKQKILRELRILKGQMVISLY